MKTLKLTRKVSGHKGTFGSLSLGNRSWVSVEPPWNANIPKLSCVPAGEYLLVKHDSPLVTRISKGSHTWTWMLQGVEGRSFILLHPANLARELEGCIAPGTSFGELSGLPAVLNSQVAYNEIMAAIGEGPARIIITWEIEEYP